MSQPVLRLNDGFDHTTPGLRDDVRRLQSELKKEGYPLEADGVFGRDTEAAVKRFQSEHGLSDDGIVGPVTWARLLNEEQPDPGSTFPTTFATNDPSLTRQFSEVVKYKSFVEDAAEKSGLNTCLICGLGSRESNWGIILRPAGPSGTGDFTKRRAPARFRTGELPPDGGGFGRGLMQIDYDAHEFARTGQWQDPQQNILYGCMVLGDCLQTIKRNTDLKDSALLQAAVASYNCGPGNVLTAIRTNKDVDYFTAGRDYSKDVLNRAGWFQIHGWR